MPSNTKTATVLLKYSVDASSANRVSNSFEDLIAEISDLNAELAKVGRASATGVAGITRELPKAESGIQALQDEVIRLRKELLALDDVNVSPTVTVETVGGSANGVSGVAGAFSSFDRIGSIGSQIGSGLGNGAIANVAGLFGDISGAASTLNPLLIGATAAIGAVSIITSELTRAYEEAQKAAADYLARQTDINELLLSGDIQSLESQRDQLVDQLAAREQTSSTLRSILDEFNTLQLGADALTMGADDLNTTGLSYVEILAAQEALINKISDVTGGAITTVGSLESALGTFDDETQSIEANLALVQISLKGVVDKMVEFADKGALAVGKLQKEVDKFGSLGRARISGEGLEGAMAARERAVIAGKQAAQIANSAALFDSVNATVKAQETLISAQNAYNAAVDASRERITELNAKLQADIASAGDERRTALLEAERDAADERVKITEDNAKEITRITQRFNRSYADAVGDRDALAAARAEQQRDDELKGLDERYKDQLKAVDDNLAKQQRVIEQRYNAQVETARSAAEAAVRLEQQRAQAELNIKAQAVQAAQVALSNAQQSEYLIRANYYNQSIDAATAWANQMHFLTAYGLTVPGGTTNTAAGQGRVLPTRAIGGPVGAGMPYVVGERGPEMFVPNVAGTIMPNRGGSMFTVNFEGATGGTIRATSKAQAIAVLDRVLTGMGAA